MSLATPRKELQRNDTQSKCELRNRKHGNHKTVEESSEENSDITEDDEEICVDEPDRANLYPDLDALIIPRSQYTSTKSSRSDHSVNTKYQYKPDSIKSNIKRNIYPKIPTDSNGNRCILGIKSFLTILFLIIIIIGGSIAYTLSKNKPNKEIRTLEEIYQVMKPDLINLKQNYPQNKQLWTQVLWQIQEITSESPVQPSTLFVVVPEEAEVSANCFVKSLCSVIANGFQDDESVMFDASTHTDLDPDDFKFKLDNSLSALSNVHCAIVHNIQDSVPKAVMLLHGYCDNENAIFKRAFIIFTLRSGETYKAKSLPQIFTLIEEHLTKAWGEKMRSDDIGAIISRIVTSPVLFKPEGSVC